MVRCGVVHLRDGTRGIRSSTRWNLARWSAEQLGGIRINRGWLHSARGSENHQPKDDVRRHAPPPQKGPRVPSEPGPATTGIIQPGGGVGGRGEGATQRWASAASEAAGAHRGRSRMGDMAAAGGSGRACVYGGGGGGPVAGCGRVRSLTFSPCGRSLLSTASDSATVARWRGTQ